MKNRKRGFSLVELLIVLAVIAALIATITPVALNAIRKAKATQVAQNLKTLASALENAAYVNGTSGGNITGITSLASLGRDVDGSKYGAAYTETSSGIFKAIVFTKDDVVASEVTKVLSEATSTAATVSYTGRFIGGGLDSFTDMTVRYEFEFTVY